MFVALLRIASPFVSVVAVSVGPLAHFASLRVIAEISRSQVFSRSKLYSSVSPALLEYS